jgi:hypothetical protein
VRALQTRARRRRAAGRRRGGGPCLLVADLDLVALVGAALRGLFVSALLRGRAERLGMRRGAHVDEPRGKEAEGADLREGRGVSD